MTSAAEASPPSPAAPRPSPAHIASWLFPEVDTAQGRLRGLRSDGIHAFKGVRYGADTGAARRFLPPAPPPTWAGVREATGYGQHAPQLPATRLREYADLIAYDLQPGGMGEDCLVLNLWTPTLDRNARKPVLVHLHGGGWYAGSGNSPQFDGAMLARHGQVVVVTLNHRLGAFGFLDLAALDTRYADSGTSGMQDIVAGLRWLGENIEAFGGDPQRVLVFGQSGGGMKTSTLLAMPSAAGLFQRAGVMSGSAIRLAGADEAAATTHRFLRLLDIPTDRPGALQRLHELPFHLLLAAQVELERPDRERGEAPRCFMPVVHESGVLPRHPFDPDAPAVSAAVPMLIGTTLDERSYRLANFDLDEAGLQAFFTERCGEQAQTLLEHYRREDPTTSPYLLQVRLETDMTFRRGAWLQADRRAAQAASGGAPTWHYLWRAPSPAWGGRYGAPHGVDIGPSLHDIRHGLNGPAEAQLRLASVMSSAWVSFAATGDPNNPATPKWPAFTVPRRSTLVIDSDRQAAEDDPRAALRRHWTGAA